MRLGQLVTGHARRGLVPVGWLAFIRMPLPDFGFGRVATPTSLTRRFGVDTGMLWAGGHCGRLAANDPEESEQGNYANSDRQKVEVFSIHKAERTLAPRVSRLKCRI